MKLSTTNVFFVFILSNLSTLVCAAVIAGSYERMFVWYAYRLSIGVNGLDGNKIASSCRGGYSTGPAIPCSFDQFIRFINGDQFDTPYVLENELFPDVDETAQKIAKKGERTLNVRNISSANGYTSMMTLMGNIISEARKKDVDKKFDREFNSAEKALKSVVAERMFGYHENKIKFLNEKFAGAGVTLELQPAVHGKSTGNYLKYQDTIVKNNGISGFKELLDGHILEYNNTVDTKSHLVVLRSARNAGSKAFLSSCA